MACPNTRTCYAVGDHGTASSTTNGGRVWRSRAATDGKELHGVSCVGVAASFYGTLVRLAADGRHWSPVKNPYSDTAAELRGVSCPTATVCYAVGAVADSGVALASLDGGAWSNQTSNTSQRLYHMACPSASACYAVGDGGVIVARS